MENGAQPTIFTRHIRLYSILAFGFLLKEVGAAFDISYHFIHFRELYQLPHIINGAGDAVVAAMLWYLWRREPAAAHERLKILWYGLLIFLFGVFFDQWWHLTFGVELTVWSPAHIMLYSGSLVALVGVLLYVARDYRHGKIPLPIKKLYCTLFFISFLSHFWFMLVQQEQAVIADYYFRRGVILADPELFAAFFHTHASFYAGIPGWVYGAWAVMSMVLVFHLVRRLQISIWSATVIATGYVTFRFLMNMLFIAIHYQTAIVPYYLLYIAFAFDLIYNFLAARPLTRDIISSAAVVVGMMFVGLITAPFPVHPPMPILRTFILAVPAAFVGYAVAVAGYQRLFERHL